MLTTGVTVQAASAELFEANRKLLWGLCYRMTGNAADAEDIVQETFVKALENPPPRVDQPLRPWLVRVALNLSRDLLRKRRRREYAGPWLPTPVPSGDVPPSFDVEGEDSPSARYEMIESMSLAFLYALEALTPTQRAVLLLRDVVGYSTGETAKALGLSSPNVKVHLHRARRRMAEYDARRPVSLSALRASTKRAIDRFLECIGNRDAEGLEKLLAKDAISLSDGGGEVAAAMKPVRGRSNVIRLMLGLAARYGSLPRMEMREMNGLPGLLVEVGPMPVGFASRFTMHFEVDAAGRITRVMAVLAPGKLAAVTAALNKPAG